MMDNMVFNIISPLKLWEDFNPLAEPLEVNLVKESVDEEVVTKTMYFTAERTPDGVVRAFAEVYYPASASERSLPVIVYIPPVREGIDDTLIRRTCLEGYVVIRVDYAGECEGKVHHTMYPTSLRYCNYSSAGEHINKVLGTARNTTWYHWAIVVRRAITLASTLDVVDMSRVMVMGSEEGSYLMWQVSAMDGRVSRAVSLIGYIPKTPDDIGEDERDAWLSCIDPRSYSQYISIPILYVQATDNPHASPDVMQEIIANLIDGTYVRHTHSVGYENTITLDDYETVLSFARQMREEVELIEPTLTIEVEGNSVVARLDTCGADANVVEIWQSHKSDSGFTKWKSLNLTQVEEGVYTASVRVHEAEQEVFVVGKVYLSTGTLSTDLESVILPPDSPAIKPRLRNKVIYNTGMSLSELHVGANTTVLDRDYISIKKGALDLLGVAVKGGCLVLKRDEDRHIETDSLTCIQLDVYATDEEDIFVKVYEIDEGEYREYNATYHVEGEDNWQRIRIELNTLKDKNNQVMPDWELYREVQISGIERVLVNNIQWL